MSSDFEKLRGTTFDEETRKMFTRVLVGLVRALHDEETTIEQIATMHVLHVHGPQRVNEIADRLARTPPTTSRLVDGLVQRGLVSRTEDPEDRRARVLELTAKGVKYVEHLNDERLRVFAENIPKFPKALVATMFSTLKRLRAMRTR